MNQNVKKCLQEFCENEDNTVVYIYGSYVNGYHREDSDIDLVGLTNTSARDKTIEVNPNISIHLISPATFDYFERGIPYTHLRMVPIKNEDKCIEISDRMKSELVRRELVRFRQAGVEEFNTLDPLNNYLLGYGVQRPWRIKPIKRIFESDEAHQILGMEYGRILGQLEKKRMIERRNGKFDINPDYVFDEDFIQPRDSFLFKAGNSYGGWHYLRNAVSMIDFARRRK